MTGMFLAVSFASSPDVDMGQERLDGKKGTTVGSVPCVYMDRQPAAAGMVGTWLICTGK